MSMMLKVSNWERFKDGLRNFYYNLCDDGLFRAVEIFYNNFFKSKTHKFDTQTPYGGYQCPGDRLRYVIINAFLEFVEGQWFSVHSSKEPTPDNVIECFLDYRKTVKESDMIPHCDAAEECLTAYKILRKEIPVLEKKMEEAEGLEWADYEEKINQKKFKAAKLISNHLSWLWI